MSRLATGAAARLGVVTVVYAIHAALALGFAWPIARMLGDPTLALPRGDLVLFESGSLYVAEVLRLYRAPLGSAAEGMSFAVLLTLYLGLFPLAGLLHALAEPERITLPVFVAAAGRRFGPLSLLLGLSLAATAVAWMALLTVGGLLETKVRTAFGVVGADVAQAGVRVVAAAMTALIAVIHDLARAAVVSRETSAMGGVHAALDAFETRPARALGAWASRGVSALLLVLVGAWTTNHIGVETAARFAAVTVLHQTVAFALVFLRADWLASAIRFVGREIPP